MGSSEDQGDVDWTGNLEDSGGLQKVDEMAEVESMKTHKFLWFIFFGVIFIIILLTLFFIFGGNSRNISEDNLLEGVSLEVGDNEAVKFKMGEEEHGMKINIVGDDFVDITISSNPINLSLKINEIKEVDLNNDGVFDLKVRLVGIVNGKAIVSIIKIDKKQTCQEKWECSEWKNCSHEMQIRKCNELNSCGTIFNRPLLKKECKKIEFVGNNNTFENKTNNSVRNTSNITYPVVNNTNHLNLTNLVCPVNTYTCYEYQGSFCKGSSVKNSSNVFCCVKQCSVFGSKEQFCFDKGHSYFESNETHICKERINVPFNMTNISCCKSVISRINTSNVIIPLIPFINFDCDKSLILFNESSRTCTPMNITCNSSADLFGTGIVTNTSVYYELKGMQNEKCSVYSKYKNISVYYLHQFIQNSLANGMNSSQINQHLKDVNEEYKPLIGKNSTCYYPISDWITIVSGWNQGEFSGSSDDPQKYNCIGTLYGDSANYPF